MSLKKLMFLSLYCIKMISSNSLPVLYTEKNSTELNNLASQISTIKYEDFKELLSQGTLNFDLTLESDHGKLSLFGYLIFCQRTDLATLVYQNTNYKPNPKEIIDYCSKFDLDVKEAISRLKIDLNNTIIDGNNLLQHALLSKWVNYKVVFKLMEMGADPEFKNTKGESARYLAALTGNKLLMYFVFNSDHPITKETASKIGLINNYGTATILKEILKATNKVHSYLNILKSYLENKMINNANCFYDQSIGINSLKYMLLTFALQNNIQAVTFLLERQIQLPEGFSPNKNPFSEDVIVLLCEKGFQPKFRLFF